MNGLEYEAWSKYYDKHGIEFREINKCMSSSELEKVWHQKSVLEIGCGSGRFTEKYMNDASSILAIDPDKERIDIFHEKLKKLNNMNHCQLLAGTLGDLISRPNQKTYFDKPFDIIVFPWSWAYIDNQKETFNLALNLLSETGMLIITMVIGGDFENFVIQSNLKNSNSETMNISNDLIRNTNSMLLLDNLINDIGYIKNEAIIETAFEFPDIETASQYIVSLVNHNNNKQVLSDLVQFKNDNDTVYMSDIVKCVLVQNDNHVSNIK